MILTLAELFKYINEEIYIIVDNYIGEPSAQEGQQQSWFTLEEFKNLDFPKANEAIIAKLVAHNF